ncbi:MAG: ATP synthase F1 subunit delta [Duncaniella sp.]|nr:ATP synthase F1 subunit delta [Duncaniella sp.]MDE5751854.1 ATP synthase F1 subunit delta [Duncaniella sp.]MDE5918095.1 ATP synthase F1 subunit delta [Duncaniella sp.]MDE6328902.1 ATP synthase F1 subunit delta [Duncaniella sp.]MDE6572599.1 ATP synthase F1 subunit delta [Duncaniella sp.]
MNQGLIPSRYAKALYEYASEQGADKRVFDLMKTLSASFEAEPGLMKVMANPFIAPADKRKLLTSAAGADKNSDSVYERFLSLLTDNNRLDLARDIALAYMKQYRTDHSIRLVTVTSASPLAKTDEERLKKLIASHLDGATMEYKSCVDPDLIGGFTVTVDNEKLDASVANELKQLRLKLLN